MVLREPDIFKQCIDKPLFTGYMPTEFERDHSPTAKDRG
jgi:hypothetical protein